LWLTPQSGPAQTVDFWSLGAPEKLFPQHDAYGNSIHSYTFVGKVSDDVRWSLVNAAGQVDTLGVAEFVDGPSLPHPSFFLRPTHLAAPHAVLAEFGRRFVLPAGSNTHGHADLASLLALSQGIADVVRYQKNSTSVSTTALQAFQAGAGVCQDQAHAMVAVCRSLGIPARYVSGYFYAANEPDLASHAWADVCLDVAQRRWVSIDITHSCQIDQRHVRLAMGTDYDACPPIKGVRQGGGEESMTVSITIEPV
jgi:transglutaminase-like putative cysteine protease